MRASSRLPHTPAASCGSPATSAARRRRAHVPGECSPPCGTASQGRYRRTDLGSARPQRLRQSGSPKPHRTRIAPPAATFRNVPKADPPAARADNLRISIRRPPAPADCGEEVRRQELPEGAGKDVPGPAPRQCGRESRCRAETRQPTPKPTEPRQRNAAEAVASSGGDPPRRPPPEADAHRPARRPEENPAAG